MLRKRGQRIKLPVARSRCELSAKLFGLGGGLSVMEAMDTRLIEHFIIAGFDVWPACQYISWNRVRKRLSLPLQNSFKRVGAHVGVFGYFLY
jgi:hypothetical protein